MAKQLTITKILKRAIQIAGIEQDYLEYFMDKRKSSRRLKFYQVHPTAEQIVYLNKLLEIAGVRATAMIHYNKNSIYGRNCLVFSTNL
jgi:hypothetical protein